VIPYDEMRRLCGLPDINLLRVMDWAREQSGLPYVIYRESGGIVREEFTISRDSTPLVERGRRPPGWTPPPQVKAKQTPPMWAINPTKQRRTK
jgi:hypothetical protein